MEYKLINWQVIEDALSSAESKEQLYDIFMASATGKIDSEMCAIKGDNVPGPKAVNPRSTTRSWGRWVSWS